MVPDKIFYNLGDAISAAIEETGGDDPEDILKYILFKTNFYYWELLDRAKKIVLLGNEPHTFYSLQYEIKLSEINDFLLAQEEIFPETNIEYNE